MQLKGKQMLIVLGQGMGAIFYSVFLACYVLPLPSNEILHSDPLFRVLLSMFGGLFLIFTTLSIVIYLLTKTH